MLYFRSCRSSLSGLGLLDLEAVSCEVWASRLSWFRSCLYLLKSAEVLFGPVVPILLCAYLVKYVLLSFGMTQILVRVCWKSRRCSIICCFSRPVLVSEP
ncbi:hypothetical protein Hanom_Chr01g00078841 [Helianthus anomalus]